MKKESLTLSEIMIIMASLTVVIVLTLLASYSFVNGFETNQQSETEGRMLGAAIRQLN
ncbi:MAG: hypothetical protein K9M45_03615 [Kiritimatiellales bacterium]|nr:hypothetical protein [Kiritimatiellales bacterium]